ncbi:acyl-CoA dehydrogenase [Streptomyces sp. NRRL WC-3618]|uniref:Acyl-CoA dehydrogenase FadE22 n=1 Tax=Streptomyces humidus TaxID=52259 RepID=A0A918G9F9_9ACTN|nr:MULTISPECIES: acyl-CoA dehydrogenase [Streptomyces]KOV68037.1 acyl-CoA dehydrogenase [Streptomyces sp. NRRL WC-3618]MCX5294026.1 acyl-CoA dehydrogenase [Streptomyces sp. NBC_00183]GGS24715.1 acyl-CoA dehydrogenase FadE22 [Streptomyces humidus]
MGLAITEEHQALAAVVRSFAADQRVRSGARAALDADAPAVPETWKRIGDLGWLSLHLSEQAGGSGFGLPELAVVVDELGHAITPGPLLATATASAVLSATGGDSLHEFVTRLGNGSAVAGLGLTAGLTRDDDGAYSGELTVLAGRWADVLLLAAGDDLLMAPTTDAAVDVVPVKGLDPSLGLAKVSVTGLVPADGHVLAGALGPAVAVFRTLAAAEAAGGARGCLDLALEYARVREQFGRSIGSFQAVKHHLADMLVAVELATALAWDAARGAATPAEAELAAAAAAGLAMRSYQECAQKAVQIFGGIGFTWEHDAHLHLRRAAALRAVVAALGSAEDDVYEATHAGVRRQFAVELPEEADTYRAEARAFLDRYRAAPEEERRALLVSSGYLVPHWAEPFGRGAGAIEQLVLEEELAGIEMPSLGIGGWVLLTLTQTADQEQVERWITPSLLGELQWCQLFSEPDAGSDAAAVRTRAERVEGGWRVTGQKVWTSNAQDCNRGLATVRTDPEAPKHRGITAMVVDLTAPGVEIRPLREITGNALFNEVFFDDVFVPDADIVGEPGGGWKVARATLGNERVTIGGGSPERLSAFELTDLALRHGALDAESRRAIARLLVEAQAMRVINLRQATRAVTGAGPSAEGNVTKLLSAEHAQRVSELALRLCGTAAIIGDEPEIAVEYLFDRCLTIAGGTSEITRNVIAERILGLPRDPLLR